MKHKFLIPFSFIVVILLSSSCIFIGNPINGNGDVAEETRKTDTFDKIKVSRGMNVYITQGDATKIVVKADENLLEVIETTVEDNVLKVTTNRNIRNSKSKKVYVTTPHIELIKAAAGSNVFSESILKCENLELSSTAGSNVKLMLSADQLNVTASAGSNLKLEGNVKSIKAKASAGSNIKAEELNASNCDASASSGANIWISVNDILKGHASSGGNVFYYGSPSSTDVKSSSGGNVLKK